MRFRTEIVVATIEIMTVTVMVCLIVWIATEMAMALPIAGTGARTTLVATNYLPLMRSSPPDVLHLCQHKILGTRVEFAIAEAWLRRIITPLRHLKIRHR
jgi:hypothetical protein